MQNMASLIQSEIKKASNPMRVPAMVAYMKNQFDFYGLDATTRRNIVKQCIAKQPVTEFTTLKTAALTLWKQPERECQYCALDLLVHYRKLIPESALPFLKKCIITKPWWDTVDLLAANVIGLCAKDFPAWKNELDTWSDSSNMWLRRTALLYQLKYRDQTDTQQLFAHCTQMAHEKEFFIAKAIGWALRQYARTSPSEVKKFVECTKLQPLSRREALKHFK